MLTAIVLLAVGLATQPAYGESNSDLVGKYIQSILEPKPPKSWDQKIQPQLVVAEQQRQEAAQKAQEQQVAEEAKRQAEEVAAQAIPSKPSQPAAVAVALPTGDAKSFIYMHESGNNPGSINSSSGACGLGQALPCSKMPCSLSDYSCQDQFFTNYMLGRYGSWEAARAFWLVHSWW